MLCGPELSGWAGRILNTLPVSGSASTGSIVEYFQYNLGKLNIAISSSFVLSGECIIPDMNEQQAAIYQQMYYCDYLTKMALGSLGAAAYDWVEIEGHDQGRIRKVAQTSVAQSYRVESDACRKTLQQLIDGYNRGQFGMGVGQVIYACRGPNNVPLPEYGYSRYCGPCQ